MSRSQERDCFWRNLKYPLPTKPVQKKDKGSGTPTKGESFQEFVVREEESSEDLRPKLRKSPLRKKTTSRDVAVGEDDRSVAEDVSPTSGLLMRKGPDGRIEIDMRNFRRDSEDDNPPSNLGKSRKDRKSNQKLGVNSGDPLSRALIVKTDPDGMLEIQLEKGDPMLENSTILLNDLSKADSESKTEENELSNEEINKSLREGSNLIIRPGCEGRLRIEVECSNKLLIKEEVDSEGKKKMLLDFVPWSSENPRAGINPPSRKNDPSDPKTTYQPYERQGDEDYYGEDEEVDEELEEEEFEDEEMEKEVHFMDGEYKEWVGDEESGGERSTDQAILPDEERPTKGCKVYVVGTQKQGSVVLSLDQDMEDFVSNWLEVTNNRTKDEGKYAVRKRAPTPLGEFLKSFWCFWWNKAEPPESSAAVKKSGKRVVKKKK